MQVWQDVINWADKYHGTKDFQQEYRQSLTLYKYMNVSSRLTATLFETSLQISKLTKCIVDHLKLS
jgi:hypothetical protein